MVPSAIPQFLDRLRRSALRQEGAEQTDGQLLEAFIARRDAQALEVLVRRHAPMVWGVCRRTLADQHDAEDAFQATFLVLLRRAASIRARELLANWLYGVAHKTACKAKHMAGIRSRREQSMGRTPEPQSVGSRDCAFGPEELRLLDEELGRLPEKYRAAIVLCDLQGSSRAEAARQLGLREGTVGSRLARGRQMLAQRLTRHGVTVSATSMTAVLAEQAASAAVPEALRTRTLQVVGQLAAGEVLADGLLRAGASALAGGVMHSLTVAKRKTVVVWLLLATLVLGSAAAVYHSLAGQATRPEEPPKPAPQPPKPNGEEPDPDKHGTAAGARNFAKNYLRDHLSSRLIPIEEHGAWRTYPLFAFWPSRDIEATFDPATHQWTLTGAYRFDVPAGLPYMKKEWDCQESDWKLVLAYDPSARAYEVQKAELPAAGIPMHGWRPTRKDDFARWLQGGYLEPRPSSNPMTALRLVVEAPEPAKLGLEPHYTYGKKDLAVEATPRGVSVRIDHGAGGPVEQWALQFGAPHEQLLKVGKYGGAYDPERLRGHSGPLIAIKHCVLGAGKQASEWKCDPGEFVVREIEVKEQKVVRLAIDFIADTEYGRSATPKRDARRIVRGSLRYNSLLQSSVPKLGADAAYYRLTEAAPAGLRGMKFVPLPKGTFYMGWNGTKGSAKKTEIKEDFEIAIYTVTQGQWQELMGNNPSWFSRQGGGREAVKDIKDEELKQFPVERVLWNEVQEFIKKLNEREKGKGYLYRLPTEAEWEYACRGGATTEEECAYHFYFEKPTNDLSSKQANFDGRKPFGKGEEGPHLDRTARVGSYAPNKLGLYDMHGNVWQWTDSRWRRGTSIRMIRGGSWHNFAESCRASCQSTHEPDWHDDRRSEGLGFRLVRVPAR